MSKNQFNRQFTDLVQKRQLLVVLVFFFVIILFWTFSSILVSQQKTALSKDLIELSQPLNPLLKVDVIQSLEQKRLFTDEELESFAIYKLVTSDDNKISRLVEISSDLTIPNEVEDNPLLSTQNSLSEQNNFELSPQIQDDQAGVTNSVQSNNQNISEQDAN